MCRMQGLWPFSDIARGVGRREQGAEEVCSGGGFIALGKLGKEGSGES